MKATFFFFLFFLGYRKINRFKFAGTESEIKNKLLGYSIFG